MKAFLVGYYGYGNTGDDICLSKTKALLKQAYESSDVLVLSRYSHSQDKCIYRWNPWAILRAMLCVDMVVFGGGGLLQNVTSNRSLVYYLSIMSLARLFRKPVIFLAQGIGPINGRLITFLTRYYLSFVTKATVRSEEAMTYFPSQTQKNVTLACDLAFYKAPFFKKDATTMSRMIGINLCVDDSLRIIQRFINSLKKESLIIHGLSFCNTKDRGLLMACGLNSETIFSIDEATYYTKNNPYDYIIAMRYHACIWAAIQGLPFIAIGYDRKVNHIASVFNQPIVNIDEAMISSSLLESVKNITSNYEFYQDNILKKRHELKDVAMLHERMFNER